MARSERLSLSDLQHASGFQRGDSAAWDGSASPTQAELAECLFFSPGDGRIWLNDQRMLLVHASAFGALRRELIGALGQERARGLLTRVGYLSGVRDAELVRKRWPQADAAAIFAAGTRLHGLEGLVRVEPLHFEFDVDQGRYGGEFLWHHSAECDEHQIAHGQGSDPACWMEIGYAIGYVSSLFGRLVIFREVECRAMGHAVCRVEGRNAERWPDVAEDLRYLNAAGDGAPALMPAERLPAPLPHAADGQQPLVGASAAFNSAFQALQRVAPTPATVLLTGESGVGKELFASHLHRLSRRADGPFVALNCAAIPENLIEAELFGVERGAFTGANQSRAGRFERAQGGTLFLDEIACLSLPGQGKLLRALQEREIERVGGSRTLRVDVRVIAATNLDLREAVRRGEFREDLFYRLNVYPIGIPPLRDRRDDVPLLVDLFLRRFCAAYERPPVGLTMRPQGPAALRLSRQRAGIAESGGARGDRQRSGRTHRPAPPVSRRTAAGRARRRGAACDRLAGAPGRGWRTPAAAGAAGSRAARRSPGAQPGQHGRRGAPARPEPRPVRLSPSPRPPGSGLE